MLSKMIPRYTRPQMGRIWEDQNKYQRWLDVELAVVETLADGGIIPKDAAAEIKARAAFSVERINEIEAEVKHDVIAFTTSVAEYVGPASRYRSEEHTSELQSRFDLVCRLLLEKKKKTTCAMSTSCS